ncbi:hypothetical protein M5689_014226 [Euphorbia peplus]|nr:hypothetical protein M5689_014226 [Euphorbia peplus]
MGGLFHFLDLNQSSSTTMARKILAHKRQHVDVGFEAPRNSLELQLEASRSRSNLGDGVVEEDCSEKNCNPFDSSMKMLINEEISKPSNSRKNAPSIVARLMGVDMLPIDTKSAVQQVDRRNGSKHLRRSSADDLNLPRKVEFESLNEYKERDIERWDNGEQLGRPRPREHPQEEELQKFKKEFEAWQAARFKECSKVVEIDSSPVRLFQKENFNARKVARNEISGTTIASDKYVRHRHKLEAFPDDQKGYISSRNSSINRNNEVYWEDYDQKPDESFAPKRIVILKPGPDRNFDPEDEESWPSSSCTIEERGSIEDFLEEVKERLKCELQGKTPIRSSGVRGSGIETPFSEKPSDPKQIAQHIAKHVRDSVTKDLGRNLIRSKSTRSYGSEIQFNGDSPEFINKNTRRFLSERLRNVLKREKHSQDVPFAVNGISGSFFSGDNAKILPKDEEQEMKTRSFRHGDDDLVINRESSPRNLVRSLSAPVTGTSFGKLLLEDRHVLTGAHIRRKHEALENVKMDLRKRKKERFNIKEKVSNFRYNLTLRGKLFGKKLQSMVESQDFAKHIMSGPTVVRNFSERHIMENSTEVPPSPASICSSAQEEFWRPVGYSSPVSTYDVTPADSESAMPQVFREISSNLNELRRQLNQLDSDEPDNLRSEPEMMDDFTMVDLEDKVEAYTRDLLVASGLYDAPFDSCLSRWDPLAKPISKSVFDKLEKKHSKDNEKHSTKDQHDHKIVYDLLNETLAMLLGPPVTMSRFRRNIISSSFLSPLRGRKLLECAWKMMKVYLNPPQDKSHSSIDSMVAENLETSPWSGLIEDEINGLGKEIESEIIGDLIQEILTDLFQVRQQQQATVIKF